MIQSITKQHYGYSAITAVTLLNQRQEIQVFFDEDLGMIADNTNIVEKVSNFLEKQLDFKDFLCQVSTEVADICFSQSTTKPSKAEVVDFAKDISILKLNVFAEDMVFYLLAPTFLPEMVMTCQITFEKVIENIELVESRFIAFDKMLDKP